MSSLKIREHATSRRTFLISFVIALYAISLYCMHHKPITPCPVCLTTSGQPYAAAMALRAPLDAKAKRATLLATLDEDIQDEDPLEEDPVVEEIHVEPDSNSTEEAIPSTRRLPWRRLPNAWAVAGLLATICGHILFHLLCRWIVYFRVMALTQPASALHINCLVYVTPADGRGSEALVTLRRLVHNGHLAFEFQRQCFEYDHEAFHLVAFPDQLPLSSYTTERGVPSSDIPRRLELYGENVLSIETPSWAAVYREQMLSPLVVFQLFCAGLWMLDEYWQYTLFTLVTIVMMESTTAFQRLRTLKTLHNMCTKPFDIFVFRDKEWKSTSSQKLLPGDIFALKPPHSGDSTSGSGVVPCDCVLLSGGAVVNEAALTGESVPQMKDGLSSAIASVIAEADGAPVRCLDIDGQDRLHVLFSGTTLLSAACEQSYLPKPPNNGVPCYALRTGFSSSQGGLIQLIEFSTHKVAGE